MFSNDGSGFTIAIPLVWTLYQNIGNKGYDLIFFLLHLSELQLYFLFRFFLKYQLFAVYNKIMIISLKLNFRVLADSTLLCLVNFYQDGNDCKGIALF